MTLLNERDIDIATAIFFYRLGRQCEFGVGDEIIPLYAGIRFDRVRTYRSISLYRRFKLTLVSGELPSLCCLGSCVSQPLSFSVKML